MTIGEMTKGYEQEVAYQKHMLKNLGYWFQLSTIFGIVLLVLGTLGMLAFGYSGWRGQQNVRAVVDDYEKKVQHFQKITRKNI